MAKGWTQGRGPNSHPGTGSKRPTTPRLIQRVIEGTDGKEIDSARQLARDSRGRGRFAVFFTEDALNALAELEVRESEKRAERRARAMR